MRYSLQPQLAGHGAGSRWRTVGSERAVLVVVRTVATLTRLLDIVALTAADRRIQTYFTWDADRPARLAAGVAELLARIEAPLLPWDQARAGGFHLAMAASENDRLEELAAPVLLVPHGVGYQKFYPDSSVVSGMNPGRLVHSGQAVPAAVALPHSRLRTQLAAVSPALATRSVVVGDPALDRMLASRHRDSQYRAGLGARGKRLVVAASTWGEGSLLEVCPDLPDRLVAQLPADEYQVAVVMHPGIWAAHGPWQVRAWLSEAERHGLTVIAPEDGWQAALTAASCVIADQGSLSLYAAALDKPLLLAPGDPATTVPDSALAALSAGATRLDPDRDLWAQVGAAIGGHLPGHHDPVWGAVFEEPGRCAQRLRPLLYRLIDLAEPPWEPAFAPVPAPAPGLVRPAALVAGARVGDAEVGLVRFPDLRRGRPHDQLDYRHLVVDAGAATVGQLGGATILCAGPELLAEMEWSDGANALLDRWPAAAMVASAVDSSACMVRTRTLTATLRTVETRWLDPLSLASLAYVRLQRQGVLPERDRLRIGDRVMPVEVAVHPA